MDDLKNRGVWLVGAEAAGKEYWYEFDYKLPVCLVLGSEGKALRPLIRKRNVIKFFLSLSWVV